VPGKSKVVAAKAAIVAPKRKKMPIGRNPRGRAVSLVEAIFKTCDGFDCRLRPESPARKIASLYYDNDMPQIQIPTPLRQYVGKQATVEVLAKNVGEALASLIAQHPELKRHLYTEDDKLRAFVNVYVNDEDMRYLQKEATALKEGDTISIVPSIAGGC
jgi:adenylyltransferase/sulfurtransferase